MRCEPSGHGHTMWSYLDLYVKHAKFIVIPKYDGNLCDLADVLFDYLQSQPNSIVVLGQSYIGVYNHYDSFLQYYTDPKYLRLYSCSTYLQFVGGGNRIW